MTSGLRLDTAQRLTSATPGAIGVIALSGPSAFQWVTEHFRTIKGKAISTWPVATARFGQWKLDSQHAEELVVARKNEETFELHCHAGIVIASILNQLTTLGATLCEPTLPPHSYPRLTLEQQAQQLLLHTTTETAAAILLDQYRGALRHHLQELMALLEHGAVLLAQTQMEELLSFSALGAHLSEPWEIQLAGPPNVGKSSLLNCILGYQRAIVHDSAGTTRDLVHANTSLDGWPFRFTDSAGIRDDADLGEAEAIGIERALAAAQTMDAIVLVLEPMQGITETHQMFLNHFAAKVVLVLNQIDRLSVEERTRQTERWNALGVSAHTGEGMALLLTKIRERFVSKVPAPGQGIPYLPHHTQALTAALLSLKNGETAAASAAIRELMSPT
jgi:tRNA modification GTPase